MEVGDRLRAARLRRGMRQEDLANKLGVSTVTVTLWENRKNPRNIGVKYLPKIAEILDIQMSELIGDRGSNPTPAGLLTLDRAETVLLRAFRSMPEKMKLFQLAQFIESASVGGGGHAYSENRRTDTVSALSHETNESR